MAFVLISRLDALLHSLSGENQELGGAVADVFFAVASHGVFLFYGSSNSPIRHTANNQRGLVTGKQGVGKEVHLMRNALKK